MGFSKVGCIGLPLARGILRPVSRREEGGGVCWPFAGEFFVVLGGGKLTCLQSDELFTLEHPCCEDRIWLVFVRKGGGAFFPAGLLGCRLFADTSLKWIFVFLNTQWGAADAKFKVPSGENTQLKRSPSKTWSRSVYSHACYAYSQGFLPCLFLPSGPFNCIFSKTSSDFFPLLAVANTGSCVGPQNKIGHPAECRFP